MSIRLRDFALLGYTMAIMETIEKSPDPKLKHRAYTLRQACRKTAGEYPGGLLDKREMKRINEKVEYLIDKTFCIGCVSTDKEKIKAITALSMTLCIMDEIIHHSKNKWYTNSFANVAKKINWLFTYLDPKYDHYSCYQNGERMYNEIHQTF